MSFMFGGSKSSGKTSSTSNIDKTTTSITPDWMQGGVQDVFGNVSKLAGGDASRYVAGANPFQTAAINTANGLNGQPDYFKSAFDATKQVMGSSIGGESLLTGLDKYFSPYQKDVIDTSLADYDAGAGQQRAQETLDMAGQGAFGGSGAAITRSLGEDNRLRSRASLSAGLRQQGFESAAGLSGQDADRRQSAAIASQQAQLAAASQMASLASMFDANQRANTQNVFDMGTTMQGYDQQQATAPLDLQSWAASMFSGLPLNLFVGQHETGTETSTGKSSGTSLGFQVASGK